ncbi:hypothetical protein [Nitrincola sp. MINF-07-Sa-05]|uniref:hypothetical protein n=1 Tax=Nitrincola salilacus TaxID=3400273 RepID=UPI003917B956
MDTLYQQIDTCPDLYAIRQLVFVNSAAYAYTEIRVDQHTALFGRNNLGKTSMLNALKLFLLAEENFKRCDRKFGFRSRTGDFYSTQDSFSYYFPEQNSFILLEAENLYGHFCILLHQGRKEFSYARIVVPCSYDEIRHLFWDFAAECNEGLGAPLETLSLSSIQKALQALDGEALHDSRTIRERLFSHRPLSREEGQFCLLPLKQGGTERELAAWKQLIHLAFDIGANDSRTLPDALATIIEGEKQRKVDELNVDLNQILLDYNQLRQERDELQRIRNAQEDWERFDSCYRQYEVQSREVGQFYVDLKAAISKEQSAIEPLIETAAKEHTSALEALGTAKKGFTDTSDRAKYLEGKQEERERQLKKTEHAVQQISDIQRAHPDLELDELLVRLQQQAARKAQFIADLEDDAKRQNRMEQLNHNLIRDRKARDRVRDQLEHHKPSVLEQLDAQSATVLYSLAQDLAETTPSLDQHIREVMQQFAQLFEVDVDTLVLCGEPIPNITARPYNPEQIWQNHKQNLAKLEREIQEQQAEFDNLRVSISFTQSEQRERLKLEKAELSALSTNIELLKAKDTHLQQYNEAKEALSQLQQQIVETSKDQALYKKQYDETLGREQQTRQSLEGLKTQKQKLTAELDRLALLRINHGVIRGWESRLQASARSMPENALSVLDKQCGEIGNLQGTLRDALQKLLRQQLLGSDGSEAYQMSFDMAHVKGLRQQFERLFSSLEGQRMDYDNRVRAHNKHTSIQMDTLRDAGQQIRGFITEINREFSAYSVSNLEEVQLACDLHPRFQLLLDDLGKINLHGEELHDERLYQRLNDFCSEFFSDAGRNGMVLQMHQLIEKVRYRFRLSGQDQFTENSQSNGTTSMVNSLLLSILLKRLLARDARICLPLVMDEMASIDHQNLQTAVAIAEQHGFVLFGASPDMSAEIVQAVNHYIYLGMFKATERAYSKQRRVVYHGACEELRPLSKRGATVELAETGV